MSVALLVCAHGTDDPGGRATILGIAAAAADLLPDVSVSVAYVDVQEPKLPDEIDRLVGVGHAVVVVPVLLTLGYHTEVDVARAVARHRGRVATAGPLGPHEFLVDVLIDRLREAGAAVTGPVVVGIAGSRRPESAAVGHGVAAAVQDRWAGPVSAGFLAAASPSVADAVAAARGSGPVAVASYLVGDGFFHRRLLRAGGHITSAPLGVHPRLVELVVSRYRDTAEVISPRCRGRAGCPSR